MPINYSYLDDGGVLLKGSGVVSGKELITLNDEIYKTPELIKKISYQIGDYSEVVDWKMDVAEIKRIADQDNHAALINPDMIFAVAASKDITFGLTRMWQAYTDESPFKTAVFRTVPECKAWIETVK